MKIVYTDGRYVALSDYSEKDIPKRAGFRWDPDRKRWWTSDPKTASKLVEFADGATRAQLTQVAAQQQAALSASRATTAEIDVPVPDGLAYLPFQRAGIAYASSRPACLIGDQMGLGKTIEAIGVINADASIRRVLVICPASLRLNWQRELTKWLVRPLSVGIVNGGVPATDIVIVNYDILRKYSAALRAAEYDLLIVDEAHYLKNPDAQRTVEVFGTDDYKAKKLPPNKIVSPLRARRRILMTGTPIVNRPKELFPLLHYLAPAAWPNFFTYARRYCNAHQTRYGWDFDGAAHLDELQERLRTTLMVRRLKADVLTELPAKRRQVIECPPNGASGAVSAELSAYARHEREIERAQAAVELAKASDDPADYEAAVARLRERVQAAFTELSLLRHDTALAKVPAVIEHIVDVLESEDKLVVMAHHHDVQDAILSALTEQGVKAVLHRGGLSDVEKQAAVDAFQNDPQTRVFVGSILASGVGITLTAASTIVFAELDWVPGNVSQAEDRLHRIGQQQSVLVQHLVLDGSLDARMAHILVAKQRVIDEAMDKEQAVLPIPPQREQAATVETPRKKIDTLAESLTDQQREAAHTAVRILATYDPDHARVLNGAGFNRLDGQIGHELAQRATLTQRQAALAWSLCRKYHRQLPSVLLATLAYEQPSKAKTT